MDNKSANIQHDSPMESQKYNNFIILVLLLCIFKIICCHYTISTICQYQKLIIIKYVSTFQGIFKYQHVHMLLLSAAFWIWEVFLTQGFTNNVHNRVIDQTWRYCLHQRGIHISRSLQFEVPLYTILKFTFGSINDISNVRCLHSSDNLSDHAPVCFSLTLDHNAGLIFLLLYSAT